MPFVNENTGAGLSQKDKFQVGRSDVDAQPAPERGVVLPFPSDPATSWLYYDCCVGAMLDSGIVVHNRLPQVDRAADTLASCFLDDPSMEKVVGGVNLRCRDQYADIVQRMGHARYWFRLWGRALRVGLQVPIPALRTIGGVPAIPYDRNPQWAVCTLLPGGNYGGVILWYAQWSLWYTTAVPPTSNAVPVSDPTARVLGTLPKLPKGVQAPFSQPDDNAAQRDLSRATAVGQGGGTGGAAGSITGRATF